MDYITVREAAEKWGVSDRSITYHLAAGRIKGTVKKGNLWPDGTMLLANEAYLIRPSSVRLKL